MVSIIVLGHGSFASGIKSALELIMGKQDNLYAIDYNENLDMHKLKDKLVEILNTFDQNQEIIIACDLFHGTPFNISMQLAFENEKIKLIYGINLNVLIEIMNQIMFIQNNIDIEKVLVKAKEGIGIFRGLDELEEVSEESDDVL
ncbi:MAG TPA: PTS sugar transporter subunit IIA [Erysipelotrichaceae bacterium]|jgi:PTS system N-acetylgalactosamine-specific IIA component|nr:PTS sugar transporter subunit IIA [Erysipelotrichaceae bacterium]HQA84605.1 PTS sugar transporter subunit IIA [Erysipelotrichaceae bacterium]